MRRRHTFIELRARHLSETASVRFIRVKINLNSLFRTLKVRRRVHTVHRRHGSRRRHHLDRRAPPSAPTNCSSRSTPLLLYNKKQTNEKGVFLPRARYSVFVASRVRTDSSSSLGTRRWRTSPFPKVSIPPPNSTRSLGCVLLRPVYNHYYRPQDPSHPITSLRGLRLVLFSVSVRAPASTRRATFVWANSLIHANHRTNSPADARDDDSTRFRRIDRA